MLGRTTHVAKGAVACRGARGQGITGDAVEGRMRAGWLQACGMHEARAGASEPMASMRQPMTYRNDRAPQR